MQFTVLLTTAQITKRLDSFELSLRIKKYVVSQEHLKALLFLNFVLKHNKYGAQSYTILRDPLSRKLENVPTSLKNTLKTPPFSN